MKKPLLSEMTLREKIGQCLLPQQWDIYQKCEIDYRISRSIEERHALLQKEQFGSFYAEQAGLFHLATPSPEDLTIDLAEKCRGNIQSAEFKKFIDAQSQVLKIPAFTAVDCERGVGHIFSDLSKICDAPALGSTDSEELAFALGAAVARELRCAGFNWRWFPVADVASRFSTGIMRSLCVDFPDRMIRLANAHISGMQSEGVAGTLKHFPGGDRLETRDSHFTQTVISSSMEEWWAEQGKIFKGIIDGGVYSVMIGHSAFPACDDSQINGVPIPATLSKKIITDLLKGEIGFEGVVITDAITMGSVSSILDYEDLIVALINAGNDVLLSCKLSAGDIIEKAVLDGRIPMERIDDACSRILNMKEKLGMFREDYFDLPYCAKDVVPVTRKINMEVARRSITLVRDRKQLLPLNKNDIKHVAIICSTHDDAFPEELNALKAEFEKRGATVSIQRRLTSPQALQEISDRADLIIYAVYVAPHKPRGGLTLYGDECTTYFHAFTSGKEKSIGVSFGYPYIHYNIMENANTFINAYSKSPESMQAFVEAIFGEIEITGQSPVHLIPKPIFR